ncbi:MAG: LPS assembly lipoprotein LptE [Acidobacteriota bacterium]|nr:LPS assembly lipoprotein LptE [Acidobacteriota bacterium]
MRKTSNHRPRGGSGAVTLLLVTTMLSQGCSYALAGQGSFLPDYIQTIGIPLFENGTTVFELEQSLTQLVRSEFIGRGQYRVLASETGVDALLTGTITGVSINPVTFSAQQQASRYVFTVRAAIEFRDVRTDEILWENPQLNFSDEYDVASTGGGAVDATLFFGQQSNAVQRLARDFARTVVSSILEAF